MKFRRTGTLCTLTLALLVCAASAHAAPGFGKLSGVVVDPSGTPQMGATVWVQSEEGALAQPAQLLTDQHGTFSGERLLPGLYSVRVTLAGFLPTIERHVRIRSSLTTLVKIELDSVFASLDRLRRRPEQPAPSDDWKWVLRSSASMRPVLQWLDGEVVAAAEQTAGESPRQHKPRARLEFTSGARRPGSVSNLADAPATAFSYDQKIGYRGRLLLAGQMSYERSAAAGMATLWLPSGDAATGPVTSLVVRQSNLGPAGPTFRGIRMAHSNQLTLGDRVTLHYGAEYIMVGLGSSTSSLRPRGEVDIRLSPNWRTSMLVAALPPTAEDAHANALESALAALDAFPAVLWRNGRPVLEGGWHEELGVERKLGSRASIKAAAFRDASRHLAVFGRGSTANPEFFQDYYSNGFLYDGSAHSWGTRVVFSEKLSEDFDVAAIYAWAGALDIEDQIAGVSLRDALQTRYRHSVAARVSGRLPKLGTRLRASYKWIDGRVVSRQDAFGEAVNQVDPNLSLSVRQPLPGSLMSGRWEALADFHNLLAQGYVPADGRDGRMALVPAFRSFRGGVSFQF